MTEPFADVEIPQVGVGNCFNVAVAGALALARMAGVS